MDIGLDKAVEVFEKHVGQTATKILVIAIYAGLIATALFALLALFEKVFLAINNHWNIEELVATLITSSFIIAVFIISAVRFEVRSTNRINDIKRDHEKMLKESEDILNQHKDMETLINAKVVPITTMINKYLDLEEKHEKIMTTLKEVQNDPQKLAQFIKEREKETPPADKDRFDAAMKSMASQKPSKGQKSSD